MPTDKIPSKKWKSVKSLISWQAAGTDSLKETIVRVTQSGNAIMFSTTMDGSALILSVYAGNDKTKEYRKMAASCIEVAQRMSLKDDRVRMMEMAQRWLDLAQQAETPG